MSALVSPISRNPRSRIARLVQMLVERQRHAVVLERLAALDDYRVHLPVDHQYRHALDSVVDAQFAQVACECPDPCACDTPGGAA
jgi:dsDNA-specific endonuclease/ATPase MutS2